MGSSHRVLVGRHRVDGVLRRRRGSLGARARGRHHARIRSSSARASAADQRRVACGALVARGVTRQRAYFRSAEPTVGDARHARVARRRAGTYGAVPAQRGGGAGARRQRQPPLAQRPAARARPARARQSDSSSRRPSSVFAARSAIHRSCATRRRRRPRRSSWKHLCGPGTSTRPRELLAPFADEAERVGQAFPQAVAFRCRALLAEEDAYEHEFERSLEFHARRRGCFRHCAHAVGIRRTDAA